MKELETDIVIIGAGASGLAAAFAASQGNYRVTLIEKGPFLGGKATISEVGTICGLFKNSSGANSEFLVRGFAKFFADKIEEKSQKSVQFNQDGLHFLPYAVEAFKELSNELMHSQNVEVLLATELSEVLVQNKEVKQVLCTNDRNEKIRINCRSLVDCSGNSIVSQLAKLPDLRNENYQSASQVFTMSGHRFKNELALKITSLKVIRKGIFEQKLASHFSQMFLVPGSFEKEKVSFKLTIPLEVNNQRSNTEELQSKADLLIREIVDFLNKNTEGFKDAVLESIAPEVGTRVGVRSKGKYVLTEDDVLSGKKFDSAIAVCSWPIEIWNLDGVVLKFLPEKEYYEIPVECLISCSVSNLFFGGRIVSADENAIASARVIGCCLQTGFAAGSLALGYLQGETLQQSVKRIQNEQVLPKQPNVFSA